MIIRRTPLENWFRERIGLEDGRPLDRNIIECYQLTRLRSLLEYLVRHSPFYRNRLNGLSSEALNSMADLAALPFTTPTDIRENGLRLLCVSQDEIARIVTLPGSGAASKPKRIFFTESDLELTVDFFHYGMSTLVEPGQKVLIFMPGELPGSVGDLLVKGLAGMDAYGLVHGPVRDPVEAVSDIVNLGADCLVGIPAQILALARNEHSRRIPANQIKSILLSTDYVPAAIVEELEQAWGCRVFNHYGMTEMGLGGAVECEAREGYHLREADLCFEIVEPDTGRIAPEGEWGEVVFTTLTRTGMPLLRYRTGDLARFIPGSCPCGTVLRRMDKVRGRLVGLIELRAGGSLDISDLDEVLFAGRGVVNYYAEINNQAGFDRLCISVCLNHDAAKEGLAGIEAQLDKIPSIGRARAAGALTLDIKTMAPDVWSTTGTTKRRIADNRLGINPGKGR